MRLVICTLVLVVMCGCSSRNPDPFEKINRPIESANNWVDRAVVRDIAMGYKKHVPRQVRDGIGNFFNNLGYLNVILNDHLQGRFAQGWRNTERMAVNTTVGVLGVFDPATRWGRPRERNDFGITLGKGGVGQGPYLMLPVLGPSSGRDVPAIIVSRVTNPMFWINTPLYVSIPMDVTSFVDQRARLQPQIEVRDRAALDRYTFTRDVYLRYRAALAGEAPEETYEEEDEIMLQEPEERAPGSTDYIR